MIGRRRNAHGNDGGKPSNAHGKPTPVESKVRQLEIPSPKMDRLSLRRIEEMKSPSIDQQRVIAQAPSNGQFVYKFNHQEICNAPSHICDSMKERKKSICNCDDSARSKRMNGGATVEESKERHNIENARIQMRR